MSSRLVEAILGTNDTGISGDEFVVPPPRKNGVIYHGNGITQEFRDGNEYWYKDGKLHRDGDLPAAISSNGDQRWYKNGKLHRDNDQPAVIFSDGYQSWFKHGHRHRDGGKPARIFPNGQVEYWVHGKQVK